MDWNERIANPAPGCIGAIALDNTTRVIGVSDGVLAAGSMDRSEVQGQSALSLVHPDDAARAADVLGEVLQIPGDRADGLYRLKMGDGSYRQFTLRATNLGREQSSVIVLEVREPSQQMRSQAFADDVVDVMGMFSEDVTLDESFDWIAAVGERHVDGLQIVITLFETEGVNKIFSRAPLPPEIERANLHARPTSLPIHVEVALDHFAQGPWRASRKLASLDFIVPGRMTSILADQDRNIVGYVEALRSTTEAPTDTDWLVHGMISRMMTAALHRDEFARRLRRAAELDPLTNLLNRRKLFDMLSAEACLADSLLYLIDLDRFSWVNNNLGHQAGDATLIAVADSLVDVCPKDALIARLGGDEFVVWVPAVSASLGLEELGSRLTAAMVIPVDHGDQRLSVRASIGMVLIGHDEAAVDAVNRADTAMYAAKRSGGDSATVG